MEPVTVTATTLNSFVKVISGIFITKANPNGVSPKELEIFCALIELAKGPINKAVKVKLSNKLNQSLQVSTNYIAKFKRKGLVTSKNRIHPIFSKKKIVIEYGTGIV